MNKYEEYVKTHYGPMLEALLIAKNASISIENNDNVNYWQHEINALIDVLRESENGRAT